MSTALERLIPGPIAHELRRIKAFATRRRFAGMSTQDVFATVYRENLWGGEPGEHNSGLGSAPSVANDYCQFVSDLVREHDVTSILDLGCGDFRVGSELVRDDVVYTGVDIVPDLIDRNRSRYGGRHVSFLLADIVEDELPDADLVLVRQVLQHLSNAQISLILTRLERYPLVVITEHLSHVDSRFKPNKDKPSGPDTRLLGNSGVMIDKPPFNVDGAREVLSTPIAGKTKNKPQTIRTWVVVKSP